MPYAATLRLDAAAVSVRRIWRALAYRAGDDDGFRLGYAPHITLVVLPDDAPVGEVMGAVFEAVDARGASLVASVGLGVFAGRPAVIWTAPAVTARLLARHAAWHTAPSRFPVHPHHCPGA